MFTQVDSCWSIIYTTTITARVSHLVLICVHSFNDTDLLDFVVFNFDLVHVEEQMICACTDGQGEGLDSNAHANFADVGLKW